MSVRGAMLGANSSRYVFDPTVTTTTDDLDPTSLTIVQHTLLFGTYAPRQYEDTRQLRWYCCKGKGKIWNGTLAAAAAAAID